MKATYYNGVVGFMSAQDQVGTTVSRQGRMVSSKYLLMADFLCATEAEIGSLSVCLSVWIKSQLKPHRQGERYIVLGRLNVRFNANGVRVLAQQLLNGPASSQQLLILIFRLLRTPKISLLKPSTWSSVMAKAYPARQLEALWFLMVCSEASRQLKSISRKLSFSKYVQLQQRVLPQNLGVFALIRNTTLTLYMADLEFEELRNHDVFDLMWEDTAPDTGEQMVKKHLLYSLSLPTPSVQSPSSFSAQQFSSEMVASLSSTTNSEAGVIINQQLSVNSVQNEASSRQLA
ncbi:hypothetical protein MIR68_010589 [Amoeboaphelidium protococcarum]|nr:hypothetical protein MIR68_010589 [Amoeboaphelidium protococcarum]